MDIDMDVDFDASASNAPTGAAQPAAEAGQLETDAPMPAAYYENLDSSSSANAPWPDHLNLQGVQSFDPNDPLYYAMEHCLEPRVKQTRWINDSSVNLQYYSADDAALALAALTDPSAGQDPAAIAPETGRKAKPFSKQPDVVLIIRRANAGDQKARGAAGRSHFYKQNPDVRGGDRRDREPRRRPPPQQRDYLDYDDMEPRARKRRSLSGDERMRDDNDYDARRPRRNGNRERTGGARLNERDREGRFRADVDSYRPGSRSPRESRFGRLRGRSASPTSSVDGDGRYGFAEDGTSTRRAYRSRSRSHSRPRQQPTRRRDASSDRWTHDRAGFSDRSGRWAREGSVPAPASSSHHQQQRYANNDPFASTSNHRRSDAFDETAKGGASSLLSRMTKDGQPLSSGAGSLGGGRSLASRITRDDDDDNGDVQITRRHDNDASYGRLKNDFSAVRDVDFSEHGNGNGTSHRSRSSGLADRITVDDRREDDDMDGDGDGVRGINIRGTAGTGRGRGREAAGWKIRGVAGGS